MGFRKHYSDVLGSKVLVLDPSFEKSSKARQRLWSQDISQMPAGECWYLGQSLPGALAAQKDVKVGMKVLTSVETAET